MYVCSLACCTWGYIDYLYFSHTCTQSDTICLFTQWADLEAIGQQKLQGGGKKCEIPAGAIPLLTADVAAAAHLPDGQGIPTITLQVG